MVEKMLEFQVLTEILGILKHVRGDEFEFEGNLYNKAAIAKRQSALFKELIEPYMVAQEAEFITEKSD